MSRNRIIYLVAAFVLIFFVINPPWKKSKVQDRIPITGVEQEQLDSLKGYLASHHRSPEDHLTDIFRERDIVFLAGVDESWTIKEHVDFVKDMIPVLHNSGVTRLGVYFVLTDDQSLLDELVTSSFFSEETARKILFRRHVMWGYQEFADILEKAWEVNQALSGGDEPFRIVGLAVRHEWQYLQTEDDVDDPEIKRQILSNGIPSIHMASVIEREFVARGRKALIMINPPHQFTRFHDTRYRENALASEIEELRTAGNIIYDLVGQKAGTVLLHYYWQDDDALYRINRAVGGIPDALMYTMEESYDFSGFATEGTPFGEIPINSGIYAKNGAHLRLRDLCDGYIMLGPLPEYNSVSPIPGFINESNYEEALKNFPAPKDSLPDFNDPANMIEYLNNGISGQVNDITRRLELFDLENR